jgi:hypothetical protein
MPHYYFDIETTGLDFQNDEILTIQFQKILAENGKPIEPLTILKRWDSNNGEEGLLKRIIPLITSFNPWSFVPVGNNLNFEFNFLYAKIVKYKMNELDPLFFHSRPYIDLKHVMIMLNTGRFKGYHLILRKLESGASIPLWYSNQEYAKIVNYIQMEANAFIEFYFKISQLLLHNLARINNP